MREATTDSRDHEGSRPPLGVLGAIASGRRNRKAILTEDMQGSRGLAFHTGIPRVYYFTAERTWARNKSTLIEAPTF